MSEDDGQPKPTMSSGMPADPAEVPGPEYKVQPRSGGEDDMAAAGKYLLIGVPQFAKDPITGNLMTSYLRLGASSSTWEQDPGGWLAAKIHEHGPPGGHMNPANLADQAQTDGKATEGIPVDTTGEVRNADHVFIDDDRNRVSGVPHDLPKEERVRQSRVIHTRGGWRDHSDGNRITTTYGDKIEVIRGNYKKIVLGRQDEVTSGAGWDVSGQIIQDFAYMMPGASVRVEESSSYKDLAGKDVWHLQNTAENIVQSTNSAGDFFDYKWGNKHWSFTGSDSPPEGGTDPNTGYPRQNPHILEKTWAHRIEGYTGSSAWRIGKDYDGTSIAEETWAVSTSALTDVSDKIEETTNAGSVESTTTVQGTVSETTTVRDSVTETTTVTNTITSSTTAAATVETTVVGAATSSTVVGVEADVTIKGAGIDVTVVGVQADVTVAGIQAEVTLNPIHVSLEIAALLDIFIGGKIDIQLGGLLEIKAGWKREIGEMHDKTSAKITNTAALYKVTAARIELG
jgi:hypothetical protein